MSPPFAQHFEIVDPQDSHHGIENRTAADTGIGGGWSAPQGSNTKSRKQPHAQ